MGQLSSAHYIERPGSGPGGDKAGARSLLIIGFSSTTAIIRSTMAADSGHGARFETPSRRMRGPYIAGWPL
ncbi:hypothetical protein CONPUDRAFT_140022 [Coniophora puteana RWD-64-598 SS2]|uniref:Uncharacterized protein n=1 Tax=Coniophora puteana (strain RWD-64-598) TaxID=741705 RepID=A0A5M3M8R4_CONPW|nr:uncharacterized protein CONPUDRAFT_140022 [Coniophora puteana RWD-64-598 SS2]EIW75589.1 hypothetical protein CONPUDRAFT_140022 [Coniophora puteana RWD-64-598 SS2]